MLNTLICNYVQPVVRLKICWLMHLIFPAYYTSRPKEGFCLDCISTQTFRILERLSCTFISDLSWYFIIGESFEVDSDFLDFESYTFLGL